MQYHLNGFDGCDDPLKYQFKGTQEPDFQTSLPSEVDVLIVGAGQSGLNLGARLQSLGLSVLIVEKTERVGDSWRHRYRTLVTHDPVQYTHMAFMRFPDNWPLFTPSKIDAYGPAKVHFQLTIIPQRTSSPTGSKCTPAPWSSTSGSNQQSSPPTSPTTRKRGPSRSPEAMVPRGR